MSSTPWGPQTGDPREERACVRCGETIPGGWRHFWPPCRSCAIWLVIGLRLLAACGLDVRPWLYDGGRPGCSHCAGSGFLPCRPQDLSTLRVSGVCAAAKGCGAPAFYLTRDVDRDGHWERVPGSSSHYDVRLDADHVAEVGAGPLLGVLADHLTREGGAL